MPIVWDTPMPSAWFVYEHLIVEWKSVLTICQVCRADGAIPLARTKRRNGAANAQRAQRYLLTADVSHAHFDDVTLMEATDTTPTTTSWAPRTTKRGRHTYYERAGKAPSPPFDSWSSWLTQHIFEQLFTNGVYNILLRQPLYDIFYSKC